jgi:hypothetical protein
MERSPMLEPSRVNAPKNSGDGDGRRPKCSIKKSASQILKLLSKARSTQTSGSFKRHITVYVRNTSYNKTANRTNVIMQVNVTTRVTQIWHDRGRAWLSVQLSHAHAKKNAENCI